MLNLLRKQAFYYIILIYSVITNAEEIKIAVGNFPPYVMEKEKAGIDLEIIQKALSYSGHKVIPVFMPLARIPKEFDLKRVDAAATMQESCGSRGCYSYEYIKYQNVAISFKNKQLNIKTIKDLTGKSIVAFQDAKKYLGNEYAEVAKQNKEYHEVPDQLQQCKMLYKGRCDVVISDKNIFTYYKKLIEKEIPEANKELEISAIFPETAFKVLFNDKKICEDFNNGLKKIKETDEYNKIFNKYLK